MPHAPRRRPPPPRIEGARRPSRRGARNVSDASRAASSLPFPKAARRAVANEQLRGNVRLAQDTIRAKRAGVVAELRDWEALRDAGAAIKRNALASLDQVLVQLETSVQHAGGRVHWARHAPEANAIVVDLVRQTGAREVVKVKSLLTDEIGLND